jgi:outer membrane lipoprotein SlyB
MSEKAYVHCPACGLGFVHIKENDGKKAGGLGGAAAGATLGAKAGLVLGPGGSALGAIAGGLFGAVTGKNFGSKFDRPRCPQCGVKFQLPEGL